MSFTTDDSSRVGQGNNILRLWPVITACAFFFLALGANQYQIQAIDDRVDGLESITSQDHDSIVRTEEQVKYIKEEVDEVSQDVKEIKELIRDAVGR